MFDNVWLIPLFPLIGFLINGLLGKKIKNETVIGSIGALAVFASFIGYDLHQADRSTVGRTVSKRQNLHLDDGRHL